MSKTTPCKVKVTRPRLYYFTSNPSLRGALATKQSRSAFPDTPGEPFWTSSTFANGRELAWYVRFDQGSGLYGRLIEPFRVRCVR